LSERPFLRRIHNLRALLPERQCDSALITSPDNLRYLCGFTGSTGALLVDGDQALFAADSRYTQQAASECPDAEIAAIESLSPEEVGKVAARLHSRRIGLEADVLTHASYAAFRRHLPKGARAVATRGLVAKLREIKDEGEIAAIERACQVADRAFEHILSRLKPGVSEMDTMLELEWFLRKQGPGDVAFPSIVASGERSSLPHGRASAKRLAKGEFVTLDFGARIEGYCSDITRTVVLGKASAEQRRVHAAVRDLLDWSIDQIRPGVKGSRLDGRARKRLKAQGFDHAFEHGLGHSLGLTVHDGPLFGRRSKATLADGMVGTVEPGIYVPGWGGVRIEHDVVVTNDGARVLTKAPTELLEL
jgi:Xaa-Pro aminopeptidase